MAAGRLAYHGTPYTHRRDKLWRTRCDDAESRWTIRLSARGLFANVGFPLRLDAVSGDSDRDDCGCRCGLRVLPGGGVVGSLRNQLHHRADTFKLWLRDLAFDYTTHRRLDDRAADLDEHA